MGGTYTCIIFCHHILFINRKAYNPDHNGIENSWYKFIIKTMSISEQPGDKKTYITPL